MKKWINIGGKLINFEKPKIMGILNATPDSFYEESRVSNQNALEKKIALMITDGVDILDVGGYSTRPGAASVETEEEVNRIVPVIEFIKSRWPDIMISIDTFRAVVAEEAVKVGANIVNDVSGGDLDERMFQVVADLRVPYILMHMRGTPKTMSSLTSYSNITLDVIKELQLKVEKLKKAGVYDIIVDPGFGFAKTLEQNYELLGHLEFLQILELPILVGLSRKRMVWKKLGISPKDSLNGTTALNGKALFKGTSILRVHDVKQAVELRKVYFF
ncbi:dihydropteroate synthase [Arcticibacterium luteifluviistationis]|uniref:dihydropteroate synthase n=1 Tax=Arcticibacterium luteifluviistationis TaxID=1784714 RepID=A0A2Z4GAC0_9BACT|nr:dihydropteroate synthase [Arcticibacterium luteifluviistationis]AWV98094.1 dihydropteroate synthase [Arcticibacterium luteifluviistationis]